MRHSRFRHSVSLLALLAVGGCAAAEATRLGQDPLPPLPAGEVVHRVFLTGNTADLTGDAGPDRGAVLRALAADAHRSGDAATVVVLGDLTADGLPPDGDPNRARAERPVRQLLDALAGLQGQVVVVPGNQDWRQGADGLRRLQAVVDTALGRGTVAPGDQSGGPREQKLAGGLRLVALDTAWWLLDPALRPAGTADDQIVEAPGDVADVLGQIVADRDDDRLIVVAHHPLESPGEHGGARSNPVASLVSRTVGLGRQDLAAPAYRQMRRVLSRTIRPHGSLVYAAAHDHVLATATRQPGPRARQTFLISGTGGGRATRARAGAAFAAARPGYQRLVYYDDGRLWQETVEVDAGASRVVFRAEVAGPNPERVDPQVPAQLSDADFPATGGTVTMAADADFVSARFRDGAVTRAVLGDGYRDMWATPAEFPVLDLGTEAGGLAPVKLGGGLQSTSLRLLGGDGHEYGLRLLEKGGFGPSLPAALREGLAGDVSLELRASMAPYGALVAAALAESAGVLHAEPRLVFVPDDPRLGRYRSLFADRLALFEVRPDDDMTAVPGFAGVTKVVSTPSLHDKLRDDPDHRVDARAYLRARLLDLLLGDWDRHQDQWRWAAFEPGALDPSLAGRDSTRGKVYLPIPRDRDFAFFDFDGLLEPIAHEADRRAQPFGERYGSVRGLTQSAFTQDRRFLSGLTRDDWQAVAQDLRARIADPAIARAVRQLPAPIDSLVGDRWTAALRARRDRLTDIADAYYRLQSGTVDVVGSDGDERFDAGRQPDGALVVTMTTSSGRTLYRRRFLPDETGEVRLYGLAGRDSFRVGGDGPARIQVRIVGGAGDDEVRARGRSVIVYDTPDGMSVDGAAVRDRRSDGADVNRYDAGEAVLSDRQTYPLVSYQATNGLEVGVKQTWRVPGFRLHPYAASHSLDVGVSTAGGVRGSYAGRMRQAVRRLDLDVDASATTPRYGRNFYGLGNASPALDDDLARVDLGRVDLRAGLGGALGQGVRLTAGPVLRYADASRRDSLASVRAPLPADDVRARLNGGAFARLAVTTVDRPVIPRQGLRLSAEGAVWAGLGTTATRYGSVRTTAAAYVPVAGDRPLTLALRADLDHRLGAFPFYDGAVLGGPGSLRGYRRERFTGRTAAVASAEVRAKLADVSTYLIPFDLGVLAFTDVGRVWSDAPAGRPDPDGGVGTHAGYGGGVWLGVLDRGVLNVTVGASGESTLVSVGLGFSY